MHDYMIRCESSSVVSSISPGSTLLRVFSIWVMLGCCARLHVWAPRSPRCLSGGLHPNRLPDAHFKKRENEQERGGCTYSTIVMQSHHPNLIHEVRLMAFMHVHLSDTLVVPSFHVESKADERQLFTTHGEFSLSRRVKTRALIRKLHEGAQRFEPRIEV